MKVMCVCLFIVRSAVLPSDFCVAIILAILPTFSPIKSAPMFNPYRKTLFHLKGIRKASPIPRLCILLQQDPSTFALKYSTATPKEQSFTVNYLINNLGFSPEIALKLSKQAHFETSEKPDNVVTFFRNLGFSNTEVSDIIRRVPKFLLCNPVKSISPKIEFLQSKGVSTSDIVSIVKVSPWILRRSLKNCLIPCYDFLKGFLHSDRRTIISIKRCPNMFRRDRAIQNVKYLVEIGLPESGIAKLLYCWPRSVDYNICKFKMAIKEVEELGFDSSRYNFAPVFFALTVISKPTMQRKVDVYKRWGWSDEAISKALATYPGSMLVSEQKIESMMEFFVNDMGWESEKLAKSAQLLTFSLEKRVIPRASVLQFLQVKGLIKDAKLAGPFSLSEKVFLQKYVICFKDRAPQLLKLYESKLNFSK